MLYQKFLIQFSNLLNKLGLRRLQKHTKIFLFRSIGFLIGSKTVLPPDPKEVRRIIIVKQDHQMGDMLCATPIFNALRQAFPNAFIALIAGQKNYHVVRNHPALNEVIFFNKLKYLSSPKEFFIFLKKLRQGNFDLGIVPATVSVSVTSDLLCRISRAKYRLGVKKLDGVENPTSFLFNLPVELDWRQRPIHQSLRNLEILHKLGIKSQNTTLSTGTTPEEDQFAETFFRQHNPEGKMVIGIHPGAGKAGNLWGAEKFARIADWLLTSFNGKIFITCGPDDHQIVEEMSAAMKPGSNPVVCRDLSIGQIAGLLRKMSLYLANDTGTMHLAAAVGVSTLSLFGQTAPEQWAPLGEKHRFIQSSDGQLSSITEEQVFKAVVSLLQKGFDKLSAKSI